VVDVTFIFLALGEQDAKVGNGVGFHVGVTVFTTPSAGVGERVGSIDGSAVLLKRPFKNAAMAKGQKYSPTIISSK
jgi:hypothetical protein